MEKKRAQPESQEEVIDITAEYLKETKKNFVEVKAKFKGEAKGFTIKGVSIVQIHGKLSKICKEKGLNYKTAFEYHEVIQ